MRRQGTLTVGALSAVIAAAALTGCDPNAIVNPGKSTNPTAANSPADAPAAEPQPEFEEAKVGVGKQGQILKDEPEGVLTTPVKTLFTEKQRIAYEIEVPRAIALYKASEGDGKGPATHEIFMDRIIKFNRIELPKLPEGDEYVYFPETEKLMVRHKKK